MIKLDDIINFNNAVKEVSSYNLSDYSKKSLGRRIEKILSDYKMTIDSLIKKIKLDSNFLEKIIKNITVNTTELFRDPKIWQSVKYRVLRKLKNKDTINIWHAGCSTGQEIYSMLIILHELGIANKANILATDINTDVIEIAKKGEYIYKFNIEYIENFKQAIQVNPYNYEDKIDVSFTKYFEIDRVKNLMTAKPFLKNKVVFKKYDLVKQDNIFAEKFDIIFCRNVLIYFNAKLQKRVVNMFADVLSKKGFLILGIHESIFGAEALKYIKHGEFYIRR